MGKIVNLPHHKDELKNNLGVVERVLIFKTVINDASINENKDIQEIIY